jgi:hypothetical protein
MAYCRLFLYWPDGASPLRHVRPIVSGWFGPEKGQMNSADVLVVLPTLGDRIGTLVETLESVEAQRGSVSLTLAVVLPASAIEARALAESYGAVIVDDPKQGISAAINYGLAVRTTERCYAGVGDDDLCRAGGVAAL